MKTVQVWYVSSGEIVRMGPFKTDREAWDAVKLAPHAQLRNHLRPYLPGTFVWPEWKTVGG